MRFIRLDEHTVVQTPWLNTREAAAYCRMGIARFRKLAHETHLPRCHFNTKDSPRYMAPVLDAWLGHPSTLKALSSLPPDTAEEAL